MQIFWWWDSKGSLYSEGISLASDRPGKSKIDDNIQCVRISTHKL